MKTSKSNSSSRRMMPAAFTTISTSDMLPISSFDRGAIGDVKNLRSGWSWQTFDAEAKPTAITLAPASEKAWAIAWPIPLVPPVTSTHFPVKSSMSYIMRDIKSRRPL